MKTLHYLASVTNLVSTEVWNVIINVIDDRFISQVRDHDLYDLAFAHVRVRAYVRGV